MRRLGRGDKDVASAESDAPSTTLLRSAVPLPRCAGQDEERLTRGSVVAGLRAGWGIMAPSRHVALRAGRKRKAERKGGDDHHQKPHAPIAMTAHFCPHTHTP
jgi:hypothetical protein